MRNSLIEEFLRFVRVLRPKAVLLENVPALADHWRFRQFRSAMKRLKYFDVQGIRDAADFGVPQRRRRLIYMAVRGNRPVLPEPLKRRINVRHAIASLPTAGRSGDRIHDLPENRTPKIRKLIRLIPHNGGSRSALPPAYRLACHRDTNGFGDVYGRMRWRDQAPTITSGCHNPSRGRFLHPTANRNITLREAAMLQGFPRSYRFSRTSGKEALATQIGNALPPPLVTVHARQLHGMK